jgi:hypothetical protein
MGDPRVSILIRIIYQSACLVKSQCEQHLDCGKQRDRRAALYSPPRDSSLRESAVTTPASGTVNAMDAHD